MLKKTVTYTNPFTDEQVTEDLYFNLTKAEIAEMAMSKGESWADSLMKLSSAKDGETIVREFKYLLGLAYGKRDGNRLIKSEQLSQEFLASEAYSELFMQLISSPDSGAEFFTAMLPKDMDKIIEQMQKSGAAPEDKRPAWIRENREPTKEELAKMTKAELAEAFRARL